MSNCDAPRWKQWLADPGLDGHLVQLYDNEDFFGEAVAHFAAEGIARNESVILVADRPHWENILGRLVSRGLDLQALTDRGQLTRFDADETLSQFMVDGLPDEPTFQQIARSTLEKARVGGRYPRVRWWGEMVNVLYGKGNSRASIRLEELFDKVAHEEQIAIFCSFRMDKFDPAIYEGALQNVCRTHCYLIPTPDDAHHRDCVDQAFAEVFGPMDLPSLNLLIRGSRWSGIEMPASQALLLWLKDAAPDKLRPILARARAFDAASPGGGP